MFYSYGSNPPLYPAWQQYLRDHQPPTLIVWGEHDEIFPAAVAERDTFYMATVNEDGWPYVQHRGGPPGFLRVLATVHYTKIYRIRVRTTIISPDRIKTPVSSCPSS